MTTVIGLTGGIGSGKSTVAKYLAELGAVVIDADKVGHEAFKSGTPLFSEVVAAFGDGILAPDGEIDRKKLGQIVFNDAASLARLNQIMHPRMREMVRLQIDEYRRRGAGVVVLEAYGLIEAGWTPLVDQVWVTVASERAVIERLQLQRNLPESDILARIRSQMSNEEREKHAQVVIRNEGKLEQTKTLVGELWSKLQKTGSLHIGADSGGSKAEPAIDKQPQE